MASRVRQMTRLFAGTQHKHAAQFF
jgi:hypothetical protein